MPLTDHKTLTYTPTSNDFELNIVFAYKFPVPAKSMVATYKWIPENETVDEKLDLTWSDGLDSYFSYVPEAGLAGLGRGPRIILPGAGSLQIRLFNWPTKTSTGVTQISGLYAAKRALTAGISISELQRIRGFGQEV